MSQILPEDIITFYENTIAKASEVNANLNTLREGHNSVDSKLTNLKIYNVADYGNDIAATITAAGSNHGYIYHPKGTYTLTTDINYGNNVAWFGSGATITLTNNRSISFGNQPILPSNSSIFNYTSVTDISTVNISGNFQELNVISMGCDNSGLIDSVSAWYICNAICNSSKCNMIIPPGHYLGGFIHNMKGWNAIGIGHPTIESTGSGHTLALGNLPLLGQAEWITGVIHTSLTSHISKGDSAIQVASSSGISAGDWIYIASHTSSFSSTHNWIPLYFEYVQVSSIVGNTINIKSETKYEHRTTDDTVIWKNPDTCIGAKIEGINFLTNSGTAAYLHSANQSKDCLISNCSFEGTAAFGASVFSDNLRYQNISISNVYSGLSTARGTGLVIYDTFTLSLRSTSQEVIGFFEESLEQVILRNGKLEGGGIWLTSLANTGDEADYQRRVLVESCFIDSRNGTGTNALRKKSAYVSLILENCSIEGYGADDSSVGISTPALMHFTFDNAGSTKFLNCNIRSKDTSSIYALGTAGNSPHFDLDCRFTGAYIYDYTPVEDISRLYNSTYWYRTETHKLGSIDYTYSLKSAIPSGSYNIIDIDRSNGMHQIDFSILNSDAGYYTCISGKIISTYDNKYVIYSNNISTVITLNVVDVTATKIRISITLSHAINDLSMNLKMLNTEIASSATITHY